MNPEIKNMVDESLTNYINENGDLVKIIESKKKYYKPNGFKGRGESPNYKKYKWEIILFDKNTNTFKNGKFESLKELNEGMNLNITLDISWRLRNMKRVDMNQRNGDNSFLSRWGHIQIKKINEYKEGCSHNIKGINIKN
jgi:hypothetical protein